MSSILQENLLTLHDAAKLLPSNRAGRKVNFSTIWRWALKGIRCTDGRQVRLEAVRLGGRWLTSRQAIERFADALTPRLDGAKSELRTPTARHRQSEAAAKKLKDSHGI